MNVAIFQKVFPVACARIAVKLRFAKIQIADAPPSVPGGLEVPCANPGEQNTAKANASRRNDPLFRCMALLSMLAF